MERILAVVGKWFVMMKKATRRRRATTRSKDAVWRSDSRFVVRCDEDGYIEHHGDLE